MFFWPLGPKNIDELMMINNQVGFKQTNIDVTLFQLLFLTILTIKEFKDETIGYLHNDTNLFLLNVLGGITLSLITQVAISLVAICEKSMNKKAMQIIFCSILIFNHITNELSLNLKYIIYIKKEISFDILILEYVKPHNYN